MELTIILRKQVANEAEADAVYECVKQKLADRPDIGITASTSKKLPRPT